VFNLVEQFNATLGYANERDIMNNSVDCVIVDVDKTNVYGRPVSASICEQVVRHYENTMIENGKLVYRSVTGKEDISEIGHFIKQLVLEQLLYEFGPDDPVVLAAIDDCCDLYNVTLSASIEFPVFAGLESEIRLEARNAIDELLDDIKDDVCITYDRIDPLSVKHAAFDEIPWGDTDKVQCRHGSEILSVLAKRNKERESKEWMDKHQMKFDFMRD